VVQDLVTGNSRIELGRSLLDLADYDIDHPIGEKEAGVVDEEKSGIRLVVYVDCIEVAREAHSQHIDIGDRLVFPTDGRVWDIDFGNRQIAVETKVRLHEIDCDIHRLFFTPFSIGSVKPITIATVLQRSTD
jgi:hypothetical protein